MHLTPTPVNGHMSKRGRLPPFFKPFDPFII